MRNESEGKGRKFFGKFEVGKFEGLVGNLRKVLGFLRNPITWRIIPGLVSG